MIRIELIANHSVEENILEALSAEGVGKFYTKYANVYGVGSTGPRMGDAVWPEENFTLVIWCDVEEAKGIERAVAGVKKRFPNEGVKLFGMASAPLGVPPRDAEEEAPPPAPVPEPPPPVPEAPAPSPADFAGEEFWPGIKN